MISVVLITYNQDLDSILFSVSSVIRQVECDCELVISDDHSAIDHRADVCQYLESKGFTKYQYLRAEKNQGIVMNLLNGVTAATGDIIKLLSPADALYAPNTLMHIEEFCLSNDVQIGFGRLAGYCKQAPGYSFFQYEAPINPEKYNDLKITCIELLKDQIINTNWVPGCALFYRKSFILKYLKELHFNYGIRFGEDLTCPLITKDGTRIAFLNDYVLWYEVGNGITTSGSIESRKRIYGDHCRFYSKLAKDNHTSMFRNALRFFKLREFIALHTPFYVIAQRIVQQRYMKSRNKSGIQRPIETEYFYRCQESER